MNLEYKEFIAEDILKLLPDDVDEQHRDLILQMANLNLTAGPAYSCFLDGKLVGCGGFKIYGVAEAWTSFTQEALDHKITVIKETLRWLEKIQREQHLWRIWAESNTCGVVNPESTQDERDRFVRSLGFKKVDGFVR